MHNYFKHHLEFMGDKILTLRILFSSSSKLKKIDLSFFVSFILVLISCCFLFKGRTGFLVVQSEKNMYQKLQ